MGVVYLKTGKTSKYLVKMEIIPSVCRQIESTVGNKKYTCAGENYAGDA